VLPRYSGVVFALGFALFIPQFYGPPVVRVVHGVLTGIGCVWAAVALWTAKADTVRQRVDGATGG